MVGIQEEVGDNRCLVLDSRGHDQVEGNQGLDSGTQGLFPVRVQGRESEQPQVQFLRELDEYLRAHESRSVLLQRKQELERVRSWEPPEE